MKYELPPEEEPAALCRISLVYRTFQPHYLDNARRKIRIARFICAPNNGAPMSSESSENDAWFIIAEDNAMGPLEVA
jgi:hypothetical protein